MRPRRTLRACLAALARGATLLGVMTVASAAAAAGSAPPCTVELRDGGARSSGYVNDEGPDGISIRETDDPSSPTIALRWDQIETVDCNPVPTERAARLAAGEALWRGRTRLARADLAGARRMFIRGLDLLEPDARVLRQLALEGVARTASASPADQARSLTAALATAAARSSVSVPRVWIGGGDPVQRQCGLVLSVPPAWMDGDSAKAAQDALVADADAAMARSDMLHARLSRAAAEIASADSGIATASNGRPAAEGRAVDSPDQSAAPGAESRLAGTRALRLMEAWADAVGSDGPARRRGRQTLQAILRSDPGPSRAWVIYAIGRSLVMEEDPESVRLGVGRMLTIPAAYEGEYPELAAAARAQSAIALGRIHDDESAASLRAMSDHAEPEETTPVNQGASQ